jgi:hypothetical protein
MPQLRLAVVMPVGPWPHWLAAAVAQLGPRVVVRWTVPQAHRGAASGWIEAYARLDARRFRTSDDAHALVPPPQGPALEPLTDGPTPDLDAVLWLADGEPAPHLSGRARLGLWRWQHGDGGDDPVGRAFAARRACVQTSLVTRNEAGDQGWPLAVAGVDLASLYRTRDALAWKLAALVPRTVQACERGGESEWRALAPADPVEALPTVMQPGEALHLGLGVAQRVAGNKLAHYAMRPEWLLGLRRDAGKGPVWLDASGFTALTPPPTCFWADPFLFEHDGTTHLFFEQMGYRDRFGAIAWAPLDAAGRMGQPKVVLQADHHLSYPFVFRHDGAIWLMPESHDAGRITLYRADPFPLRWVPHSVQLERGAIDPTLVQHDGRWWLFANVPAPHGSTWDELHVWHADDPRGPWAEHAANPIVSDVRSARPAGQLFSWHGALVRPGQECAPDYGAAVRFRAVERLTPTEYVERPLGRLGPTWHGALDRTHTFNSAGGWQVVDGRRLRPRFLR